MAISKLEVGVVPLGEGGDTLRSAAAKLNANFEDPTNAASRLVGTDAEQIPLSKNIPSLLGTVATKNVGTGIGNVPVFDNNNALGAQGYIQAGINAPKIAYKKITAAYPTGDTVVIPHGITSSKILSVSYNCRNSIGFLIAAGAGITNNMFYAYEGDGNVTIGRIANDRLLVGQTLTILITYEV